MSSNHLVLSYLKINNFEKSDIYINFYNNICKPLFKEDNELLKVIQFFFDPEKYSKIKEFYRINFNNIDAILYGYRFCLNEFSTKNENGIYYSLYDICGIHNLSKYYYPGNDIRNEPYYKLYSKIKNHFVEKPYEGCYICLCKMGYYHYIPSLFPGFAEQNLKCPKCLEPIGAISKNEKEFNTEIKFVKRDKYFRIFYDDNELNEGKKNKEIRNKIDKINVMTLDNFKKKYINSLFEKEKGLSIIDKNHFKKDNKIIRNLSQISYRLLNFILYSHLFFARLYTNNKNLDKYLPKGMNWLETLNECWILLKNELYKKGINSIDLFMNNIFKDIFTKLNNKNIIDNYGELIDFEDELESLIQEKIKIIKEDKVKYQKLLNEDNGDKYSSINLLKEKYEKENYPQNKYPFYEYFYYCDYLDEEYVTEILNHMDENKYPVLNKYLEYQNNKNKRNEYSDYSLDNLNLFNSVLNLFNEKYSNKITREFAEKVLLKDEEIYLKNKELIDKFIAFYNSLKNKHYRKLSTNNHLCDFFLDADNEIGRNYIDIYMNFIKKQNEEIEKLLDIKIDSGIFNINCKNKINIQQIKEDEIFNLKHFSFINLLFDSSYRKIIDNKDYRFYNHYEINLDFIEEKITELFLKNKKLLNEDIIKFSYNNEVFSNQVSDIITSFKKNYSIRNIDINEKVFLYKYFLKINENTILYQNIIDDFIFLMQYLNDLRGESNDNKNNISEQSKIYEVIEIIKDNLSKDTVSIFKDKNSLTIDKISEIFDYFLKLINRFVKNNIEYYQKELEDKDEYKIMEKIEEYSISKHIISKEDFIYAIRLFMALVLFREEDKNSRIKNNRNNLINYLKVPDFWDKDVYNDKDFNLNLIELKSFNIQINKILDAYKLLCKDCKDYSFDDVRKQIRKEGGNIELESEKEEEEEEEEEEISCFSPHYCEDYRED